mmetsp:Transcript_37500/g.82107  ORF Transcript_37500/g.82107 Transcript_37500/m.82107 type:complete len:307 (-) Transcript_37500:950-1870(-)
MTLKVQIHSFAEAIGTKESIVHANNLSSLAVNSRCVEIVHTDVALRPDGVAHRTGIFIELASSEASHIFNTLDGVAAHISRELLVSKHSKSLLERELEPIPASYTVACPVVKVLMSNDAFDSLIIHIGSSFFVGKDVSSIENIEAFIFHRSHVKVIDGNDIVQVEIVLQSKPVLVPLHGSLKRLHGIVQFADIVRLRKDLKVNLTARRGGVLVRNRAEITSNNTEQIRRLGERIRPNRIMSSIGSLAFVDFVAVGQKDGVGILVGLDPNAFKYCHIIGTVGVISNTTEAGGLALRAIHWSTLVQAR